MGEEKSEKWRKLIRNRCIIAIVFTIATSLAPVPAYAYSHSELGL